MINPVGIDVQSKETVIHMAEQEAGILIHKTAAVGWSEGIRDLRIACGPTAALDLEQAAYSAAEAFNSFSELTAPLWDLDTVGPPGRPKRNKSKLKQQRESRRRNRK